MNTDNKDIGDLSTLSPLTREVVLAFCLLPDYHTTEEYARFLSHRSQHRVLTAALEKFIQESPLFESRYKNFDKTYGPMVYRVKSEVVLENLKYLDDYFIKSFPII